MTGQKLSGVVVVDKPSGPTSHDVVARARRALGEKRIGHAGTLDPLASGVLVLLVGEATKLAGHLTAQDKSYRAGVALGAGTTTLDAEGEVIARSAPTPELLAELDALERGGREGPLVGGALAAERARTEQVPPAFSAIQVGGVRSYERARAAGPDAPALELAPRAVAVRSLTVTAASPAPPRLELELTVSKGYYVRSLARDLGERLGVPAHLDALRRLASGPFTLEQAVPLDRLAGAPLERASVAAARALGSARLTAEGERRARAGQRLDVGDFEAPPAEGVLAWLSTDGRLVALGERRGATLSVLRGFTADADGVDGF